MRGRRAPATREHVGAWHQPGATAVDQDTKRAQTIRINLLGGYEPSELEALRKKHEAAFAMEARR